MKLLNELLTLSEAAKGTTLVGLTIARTRKFDPSGKLITDDTKNEVWTGDFYCDYNPKLESLEGAPKEVKGDFWCSNNRNLVSLKGAPEKITGNFICASNPNLVSLEGAPKEVKGDFSCSNNNNLKSLEGAPEKVDGYFNCSNNPNLESLEGAPEKVGVHAAGGGFTCGDNPNLTSLEGIPKEIGGAISCTSNPKLTSLKGIHKQVTSMGGKFFATDTPIKSHVLGLLLIKDCIGVSLDNKKVQKILNKYLPNTRGNKALIECQSELLDADLDDFAEL